MLVGSSVLMFGTNSSQCIENVILERAKVLCGTVETASGDIADLQNKLGKQLEPPSPLPLQVAAFLH